MTLPQEIDQLRAELDQLRAEQTTGTKVEKPQLRELTKLSNEVLEKGEEVLAKHPLATVAGALALGIAIGRLLK
jgi:hypothetical protein